MNKEELRGRSQEPVAWMVWGKNNVPSLTFKKPSDKYVFDSLYTTPPQRKPLTDEQLDKAGMKLAECMYYPWEHMPEEGKRNMRDLAKAIIEAAHGIKE